MFTLTLVYPDGRTWLAGTFTDMNQLNAWLDKASKQSDWDQNTTTQIVQIPSVVPQ
jgi:hypothetical protein